MGKYRCCSSAIGCRRKVKWEMSVGAATGYSMDCRTLHSPTCKTLSTHPISSNFNPLQNERFWGSPPLEFTGVTRDKDEYMHMSLSFLGNDQKMILRWTGSGILSYRSSILWKGIFSATILAVTSSKVSGEDRAPTPAPATAVEERATQHDRLATATAIDDALSLTNWSSDSPLRSVRVHGGDGGVWGAGGKRMRRRHSWFDPRVCACVSGLFMSDTWRKVPDDVGARGGVYVHMMGRLKAAQNWIKL